MSSFKYAHFADLHLGSWREEKMRDLSTKSFLYAIDDCIQKKVDFILFAGDLFNTSLPAIDTLKIVTKKLKELHTLGIPLYVIAGSHDFSPSGKTMIDVLEHAGLLQNVCKGTVHSESKQLHLQFTIDPNTGAKITGILGRKGQLDKGYYQNLFLENLEQEVGYKIFMFHTSITELKPKHLEYIESQPVSFLPKRFNYYAGGHLHHRTEITIPEYGILTYPGALFPNNFAEVEKYSHGGYYLITVENNTSHNTQQLEWIPVKIINHLPLNINCHHKSPEVISFELLNLVNNQDLLNTLVTLRLQGTMEKGKIADINFTEIIQKLYAQEAYFVMKNTAQLSSEGFEEIKIIATSSEDIEHAVIKEHLQQSSVFDPETELHLFTSLLTTLNITKKEGETITDFHNRIEDEMNKLLQTITLKSISIDDAS